MPTHTTKIRESHKKQYTFSNPEDIQKRFNEQNEESLIGGLISFRNQITIKHDEDSVSASDERFLLVKSWLDVSPGAFEVFSLWEHLTIRQLNVLTAVISVLSALLNLLGSQYTYHTLATPIVKSLLTQQWYSKLNMYLSTTHNELILVTLKLYYALSMYAGGKERRTIYEVFPWDAKSIPKFLHMRRKKSGVDGLDILLRPDIRTLYVLFMLSFVDNTTSSSLKAILLEQRREHIASVFKGLNQDPYSVVRRVLEICWAGIWADPRIRRSSKLGLFSESTIHQLLRLYERNTPEGPTVDDVTADVVHHFLLAISTRPGTGVCFQDCGWYPRENAEADEVSPELTSPPKSSSRIHNKILANVLKSLKVNEDARQQELAYRILKACPELIAGYWATASLTLEPRLSSRWIANVAFFGSVISLPAPVTSFRLTDSDLYKPSPPPLAIMTENILPSVNIRAHLSRGLQSPSALVQHCTAIALAKCLTKYGEVLQAFRNAEISLEEDDEGQWTIRRLELEREIARRVPEFQVIVAFAQQVSNAANAASDQAGLTVKYALLAECAQRLLWLYHESLPSLVAEVRFDVGKLLYHFQTTDSTPNAQVDGWNKIRELHVLRLLKESDQFTLAGKTGSPRGTLNILLKLYVSRNGRAIRVTLSGLLRQTLSSTILFQHDVDELELWLSSLPLDGRTTPTEAPDDTPLNNEADGVVAFLDDCAQRCLKTPYRYLENLARSWTSDNDEDMTDQPASLPSPLLMTVLEQLEAKLKTRLLTPSDALSIFTYARKLLWSLAQKVRNIRPLLAIAQSVSHFLPPDAGFGLCIQDAIRREIYLSAAGLHHIVNPSPLSAHSHNYTVDTFLEKIDCVPCSEGPQERRALACELVDWLRLAGQPLHIKQFERLVDAVTRFSIVQCRSLFEYLDPTENLLWEYVKTSTSACDPGWIDFPLLFMHSDDSVLEDAGCRDILSQCFIHMGDCLARWQHCLHLVDLRLASSRSGRRANLIRLLQSIVVKILPSNVVKRDALQEILRMEAVQFMIDEVLPDTTCNIFSALLDVLYCAEGSGCRTTITALATERIVVLANDLEGMSQDQIATASMWIQFAELDGLSNLIDIEVGTAVSGPECAIIEQVISALDQRVDRLPASFLSDRLYKLLSLREKLSESRSLERIIDAALRGALPLFVDGRLISSGTKHTLAAILDNLPVSPSNVLKSTKGVARTFLEQRPWTDHTASIVSRLLYMDPQARTVVAAWLRACTLQDYRISDLVRITHALLDCSDPSSWSEGDCPWLSDLSVALIQEIFADSLPPSDADMSADFMIASLDLPASISQHVLSATYKTLRTHDGLAFNSIMFVVSRRLIKRIGSSEQLTVFLVEGALHWALSVLSEDTITPALDRKVVDIVDLLQGVEDIDVSLVEVLLTTIIRHHLGSQSAVSLAMSIARRTQLKPVTVNRYIQAIVQHPRLHNFCSTTSGVRGQIVGLLGILFATHPTNSCQLSHVEPLLHIYGGTLSKPDQGILQIFLLFEQTRKTSITSLLTNWSPSPDVPCGDITKALQNLNPNVVWRTCLHFPQRSSLVNDSVYDDETVYDPLFIALLCSCMTASDIAIPTSGWVQLFRTNLFSLLIRALSSRRNIMRQIALVQLAAMYNRIQNADIHEKPHIIHIFNLIKNLYPRNCVEASPERLPAYATLHLAHALKGVFYPSHFTYPITARFLLQRPELDPDDVPSLYTMLYSTSEQWRKERVWIIRFLTEGMVGRLEWNVLRRRHTWDLVASILDTQERDRSFRRGILEFLANLTSNQYAATSLLLKHSLLSWIELQLPSMHTTEGIAWVRILENLITTVDSSKVEAATRGEWRSAVNRCLLVILNHPACTHWSFMQATQVALRLARLTPHEVNHDAGLIKRCMESLKTMEALISLGTSLPDCNRLDVFQAPLPPYTAHRLWDVEEPGMLQLWGLCVETMWAICMERASLQSDWYALTQRLLLWRTLADCERPLPQWVRRQVVCNLQAQLA